MVRESCVFNGDGYPLFITEDGKTVRDGLTGRVKNLSPATGTGYVVASYGPKDKRRGVMVHRLVAMAFLPNPEDKPCVNHIDGNKSNNDLSNLEWVTHKENSRHAYDSGLCHYVERNKIRNEKIKELWHGGLTQKKIAEMYGLHIFTISKICRGVPN